MVQNKQAFSQFTYIFQADTGQSTIKSIKKQFFHLKT
jgi:hypothetical protein